MVAAVMLTPGPVQDPGKGWENSRNVCSRDSAGLIAGLWRLARKQRQGQAKASPLTDGDALCCDQYTRQSSWSWEKTRQKKTMSSAWPCGRTINKTALIRTEQSNISCGTPEIPSKMWLPLLCAKPFPLLGSLLSHSVSSDSTWTAALASKVAFPPPPPSLSWNSLRPAWGCIFILCHLGPAALGVFYKWQDSCQVIPNPHTDI